MGAVEAHFMTSAHFCPEVASRLAALDALQAGAACEAAILAALEDEAPVVREKAIRLATRYIEPQVLGTLVADEVNATKRNAAITALERQGPYAVSHLEGMLRQYQADVVMFALQALARIGDPAAIASVLPFMRHPDLNVAQAAIEALGKLRSAEAVPQLVELLQGKLWLQLAAIDALGEIGDPRAVGPLLELVPDSVVAEPALKALQRIAGPESLAHLLAWLSEVHELLLRDSLLLVIGAVIDRHPGSEALAAPYGSQFELDRTQGVLSYLESILSGLAPHSGGDSAARLRSATALAVAAGVRSLFPLILIRVAGDPSGNPGEAYFRRYPDALGPSLPQLLEHQDPRVRQGALLAGIFNSKTIAHVLPQVEDSNQLVRAAACRALGRAGAGEAAPLLVGRLIHGGSSERAAAIEALGSLPADSLRALAPCLHPDATEQALVGALEVLGQHTGTGFEERIIELTLERSTPVRKAALRAAARLPGSRADVVLLRALADREQLVQVEALDLLVRRGGAKAVSVLAALLGTGDSLRCYVIRALGHLKATEAAARLEALYPECGPRERIEILEALIRISPSGLAGFLLNLLDGADAEFRRLAAQGLAGLADKTLVPNLRALAHDPDWNIRNEAARGFGLLAEPETQEVLLCLVRDMEPAVAQTARAALDRVRARSESAAA